jgi:hypothetical protein
MKQTNNDVWVFVGVGILVLLLSIGAFYLSFNAISTQATNADMASGPVFALMVDGAIIVFSFVRLYSTWNGKQSLARWCFVLILAFVALSVWFNVGGHPLDVSSMVLAIHALPPLMLLFSFEVGFIEALKVHLERNAVQNTIFQLETQLETLKTQYETDVQRHETLQQTIAKLNAQIETLETKRQMKRLTERQEQILKHLLNNIGITSYDQLANSMQMKKTQIYTPTKKMLDMGIIRKHDDGFVVIESEYAVQ